MYKNKFIFWQNILSMHQATYLKNLSVNYKVIIIVEKSLDDRRVKDGWEIPDFGNSKIIIRPDDITINRILDLKNAIHIFSGIDAYPLVKKSLNIAIKKKCKIGIISEPFNWLGIKGKLRFIKYRYLKIKYEKSISFILAIGNRGRWCFEKVGFSKDKIFDWGYFVQIKKNSELKKNYSKEKKILFIGSLDKRKNILNFINSCIKNKDEINKLYIIGKGPLENRINKKITNLQFIKYLGVIEHQYIYDYIVNSNLVVLPSIFDGWGAVINEALMSGTPVLTNENCGASVLIKKNRGKLFSLKEKNLTIVLKNILKELPYNEIQRQEIQNWANENISGLAAANYFMKIILNVFYKGIKPLAPWL